jgi:hypothetical protein
MGKTTKTV